MLKKIFGPASHVPTWADSIKPFMVKYYLVKWSLQDEKALSKYIFVRAYIVLKLELPSFIREWGGGGDEGREAYRYRVVLILFIIIESQNFSR